MLLEMEDWNWREFFAVSSQRLFLLYDSDIGNHMPSRTLHTLLSMVNGRILLVNFLSLVAGRSFSSFFQFLAFKEERNHFYSPSTHCRIAKASVNKNNLMRDERRGSIFIDKRKEKRSPMIFFVLKFAITRGKKCILCSYCAHVYYCCIDVVFWGRILLVNFVLRAPQKESTPLSLQHQQHQQCLLRNDFLLMLLFVCITLLLFGCALR